MKKIKHMPLKISRGALLSMAELWLGMTTDMVSDYASHKSVNDLVEIMEEMSHMGEIQHLYLVVKSRTKK